MLKLSPRKVSPARFSSTDWPRWRASAEASPTLVPADVSPCRGIAPLANSKASRRLVLPTPGGPIRATARPVLERLSMAVLPPSGSQSGTKTFRLLNAERKSVSD